VQVQARPEASAVGRALLSVLVTVTVLAMVVVNMPASHLRDALIGPVGWFVRATGLEQDWGVFAPPRNLSLEVLARVDDADGSATVVRAPQRLGLGSYVDYRWHKYEERLRLDERADLWEPYARFVAAGARAEGRDPVCVTLVRRWAPTLPPGPGPEREAWKEYPFYVLPLP
jgi:hypothetical protein